MIHPGRIRHLVAVPPDHGRYVLYWMQQAQRTCCNHALEFAAKKAGELHLPLVVGFVLTPDFPEAGFRHYRFMLQGLAEVQQALSERNIAFVMEFGDMLSGVAKMAKQAAWLVVDAGYLRIQRQWRRQAAARIPCPFSIIETDVVVPVAVASNKQETAARTLRPKIMKQLDAFVDCADEPEFMQQGQSPMAAAPPIDPQALCSQAGFQPRNTDEAILFKGGQRQARKLLSAFIENNLADYHRLARDPAAGRQSDLSPYLHFGQISPVEIVRRIQGADAPDEDRAAFVEQLVVRRELAVNLVYHNPGYDQYEHVVPAWAQKSLDAHRVDPRPWLYTAGQLESAQTHDPYWNAAQMEMVRTGKMHNYMRMYWGKKIIEWSQTPEQAFATMMGLNNRYELDGRGPNAFAGVAWCFGCHDRPWKERPVFGKIRYMNAAGLERKFNISAYASRHQLPADSPPPDN